MTEEGYKRIMEEFLRTPQPKAEPQVTKGVDETSHAPAVAAPSVEVDRG